MKKLVTTITMTLLALFAAGTVHAALITQNFSGQITSATDGNVFGVAANDTISWTTTYDLTDYNAALGTLVIGQSSDYNLDVCIGNRTFDETEDLFYGPGPMGSPFLYFNKDDVTVSGISFTVDDYTNGYRFKALGTSFEIYEIKEDFGDGQLLVSGILSCDPVPVPSAILLLGAGLAGLAGLRRKNS